MKKKQFATYIKLQFERNIIIYSSKIEVVNYILIQNKFTVKTRGV